MAGWPEMLLWVVNGTNEPARMKPASGASRVAANVPCGGGGSPSVGVSRRS